MLLKANQGSCLSSVDFVAVYDDSLDVDVRYPTSLWAGYGFSNSLPADLLKVSILSY